MAVILRHPDLDHIRLGRGTRSLGALFSSVAFFNVRCFIAESGRLTVVCLFPVLVVQYMCCCVIKSFAQHM